MLITDDKLAEALVEVTPSRCLVMVARLLADFEGRDCTSPYECCACAMPAKRHDRPCEICGATNYRPVRRVGGAR